MRDKPIPEDKKILATDEELDKWIASHYGMTLDNLPHSRPNWMPKVKYERLKKYNIRKGPSAADKEEIKQIPKHKKKSGKSNAELIRATMNQHHY